MTNEELNEYIFAGIVESIAFRRLQMEANKLIARGATDDELDRLAHSRVEYIRGALDTLKDTRKLVFQILAEATPE